jgi:DNA mismatch repair protein MutL
MGCEDIFYGATAMSRIQILSDEIVNQIAAGEVVERPASALKELVDNAIDAGAQWIHIDLEKGGLDAIIVRDDGCGMEAGDARLSLRRHATSKIRSFDDLFSIRSMGFRGEALAAISSVSKLTLTTVPAGSQTGVKIVCQKEPAGEGEGLEELPWSGPSGTTVAVHSLFYNVPARAKFVKSAAVEFSACLELIQAMSLCYTEVGFSLRHQGKEQFRVPPGDRDGATAEGLKGERSLRARAKAVLGKEATQLLYVTKKGRFGGFEALISPPGLTKGSGQALYFFVNDRWVKDKVMRQALLRGYHSHLPTGRFPWAILHLSLDPSIVDINVHPAKTEIRFQYAQEIHQLIADTVRECLRQGNWSLPESPWNPLGHTADGGSGSKVKDPQLTPSREPSTFSLPPQGQTMAERRESAGSPGIRIPSRAEYGASAAFSTPPAKVTRQVFELPEESASKPVLSTSRAEDSRPGASASVPMGLDLFDRKQRIQDQIGLGQLELEHPVSSPLSADQVLWDRLEFVGSFAKCYLIFRSPEALLVVDQHAFHERILYEMMVKAVDTSRESQALLVPEGVDLSPTEVEILMGQHQALYKLGFDYKKVGTGTLEILAVPPILVGRDLAALFTDLVGSKHEECPGVESSPYPKVSELSHDLIATIACHGAVRAGEDLMPGELRQLLSKAQDVDFFHNCPHGRRVFRWWNKNQIARWFDR